MTRPRVVPSVAVQGISGGRGDPDVARDPAGRIRPSSSTSACEPPALLGRTNAASDWRRTRSSASRSLTVHTMTGTWRPDGHAPQPRDEFEAVHARHQQIDDHDGGPDRLRQPAVPRRPCPCRRVGIPTRAVRRPASFSVADRRRRRGSADGRRANPRPDITMLGRRNRHHAREDGRERAADARGAAHRDAAALRLDEALGQRQTQARALVLLAPGRRRAAGTRRRASADLRGEMPTPVSSTSMRNTPAPSGHDAHRDAAAVAA